MSLHKHGSYYTAINADCTETCEHALNQSFFITGHYELLSKDQGKLGSLCLSEVQFNENKLSQPTKIPSEEYCIMTNSPEHQDFYVNRTVDISAVTAATIPTYGQFNDEKGNDTHEGVQSYVASNLDIVIHDQVYMPAVLDAKWSHQPIYARSGPSSSALIASALEDGSIRLFSQDTEKNTINPQCALQISAEALCLYISWSNKQRYSYRRGLFGELSSNTAAQDASLNIDFESEQNFTNIGDFSAFWRKYDAQFYTQTDFVPIHSKFGSDVIITPHLCADTPSTVQIDEDINVDEPYYCDENEFYQHGKQFTDNFLTCSLTDGTVAVCDVVPTISTSGPSFGLRLTHHWQAHQAECWVATPDSFNPNMIYTGGDDHLFKLWDLRMIDCVNHRVAELEINPFLDDRDLDQDVAKNYIYTKQDKTTCPRCDRCNLSLFLPQFSPVHGVSVDISQCGMHRGHCIQPECYCNGSTNINNHNLNANTLNYKLNVGKLSADRKFSEDFTPTQSAYELVINTAHKGGIVDIQPHPYNPFLLMTGSYDNHVSLYDKRKLKVPICRQDTGGGAWRIKWHPNPVLSNYFLLVNMYNGTQVGHIEGMDIKLGDEMLFKNDLGNPQNSKYPEWAVCDEPNEPKTPVFHGNLFSAMRLNEKPTKDPLNPQSPAEMVKVLNAVYNYGGNSDVQPLSSLSINFDTKYTQHGPKAIVYGGDWSCMNNISEYGKYKAATGEVKQLPNIAIVSSFYNKRTDILHFD